MEGPWCKTSYGADFTLWKEAYGRNFLQQCNSTTWTLYVEAHSTVYNGEGLEFKGVFISIAPDLCENLLKWIYSAENGS